jgi:hypothetical protein
MKGRGDDNGLDDDDDDDYEELSEPLQPEEAQNERV